MDGGKEGWVNGFFLLFRDGRIVAACRCVNESIVGEGCRRRGAGVVARGMIRVVPSGRIRRDG